MVEQRRGPDTVRHLPQMRYRAETVNQSYVDQVVQLRLEGLELERARVNEQRSRTDRNECRDMAEQRQADAGDDGAWNGNGGNPR